MVINQLLCNNSIKLINVRAQNGATDRANIQENTINFSIGNGPNSQSFRTDAIEIVDPADGYLIYKNTIRYYNGTAPVNSVSSVGIGTYGVTGINNFITTNQTIRSTLFIDKPSSYDAWLRCGIHVQESPHMNVCNNDVDGSRHDYHYQSNCSNIEHALNVARTGQVGLEVWDNMIPVSRDFRKNRWTASSYGIRGARVDNNLLIPPLLWLVDQTVSDALPPSQTPSNWFVPAPFVNLPNRCEVSSTPPLDPDLTILAEDFLNGTFNLTDPVKIWDFERDLLEKMIRFPNSFSSSSSATQYYSNMVDKTIWKLANAERMLSNANKVPVNVQQTIDSIQAEIQMWADSLERLQKYESEHSELGEDKDWQFNKLDVVSQMQNKNHLLTTEVAALTPDRDTRLANVQVYLDGISTSTTQAGNYRTLLTLKCKEYRDIAWASADSIALRNIAYSCPGDFGFGVFIAREMLPATEAATFVREMDDPYCATPHEAVALEPVLNTLTVWPNPAEQAIQIGFPMPFSGQVRVVHLTTGTVQEERLLSTTSLITLQVAEWPAGIYLLRTEDASHRIEVRKFLVIH